MGFFYRAKPRQFNYRPLYYDPDKERRDKRREELLGKKPDDGEYQPGDIIRGGGMRANRKFASDGEDMSRIKRAQTTRMVVILALLLGIVAIIFFV